MCFLLGFVVVTSSWFILHCADTLEISPSCTFDSVSYTGDCIRAHQWSPSHVPYVFELLGIRNTWKWAKNSNMKWQRNTSHDGQAGTTVTKMRVRQNGQNFPDFLPCRLFILWENSFETVVEDNSFKWIFSEYKVFFYIEIDTCWSKTIKISWHVLKSSSASATYMCQWIRSVLAQIMACRLFDTKPLSEPMKIYCQLNP